MLTRFFSDTIQSRFCSQNIQTRFISQIIQTRFFSEIIQTNVFSQNVQTRLLSLNSQTRIPAVNTLLHGSQVQSLWERNGVGGGRGRGLDVSAEPSIIPKSEGTLIYCHFRINRRHMQTTAGHTDTYTLKQDTGETKTRKVDSVPTQNQFLHSLKTYGLGHKADRWLGGKSCQNQKCS